jgi:lysophospholipase L1-like esterase
MASGPRLLLVACLALLAIGAGAVSADAKSARLKRLVVIGDSILAGYSSGGFVERGAAGQVWSAPAFIARRAHVRLPQPLMDRPGVPPPYRIDDKDGDGVLEAGEIARPDNGIGFRDDPDVKVRNLAVPGEDMQSVFEGVRAQDVAEQLVTGSPDGRDILKFLILGLPLRDESVTQISRALALRPSFFMVWIGNNDVLGMATKTDPTAVDRPVQQFGQLYRQLLNQLANANVDMAVATLPDVTGIAVLRRAAGEVTQCQRGDGTLEPVAADDRLSIGLDPARLPIPPCIKVLSAVERAQARANVVAFNAEITAAAAEVQAARGITVAVVDVFGLFDQISSTGVDLDGNGTPDLTSTFLGGVFSPDGIHPTRTGNALIANAFIDVLNTRFGEAISPVDVAKVASRDPWVNNRFKPAGEPPFGLFSEAQVETSFEDSYRRIEEGASDIGDDLANGVKDVFDFFRNLTAARPIGQAARAGWRTP